MAAPIVTKEQVFSFCDEIQAGGEAPTITLLYPRFNNRGGYSTIGKYLKEWRDTHREARLLQPPPDLPDDLIKPVEHALRGVMGRIEDRANQRIKEVESRSEADIKTIMDDLSTANNEIDRLETVDTENRTAIGKLGKELDAARQTIAARDEKIAMLEHRLRDERTQAEKDRQAIAGKLETARGRAGEQDQTIASLQAKLSSATEERERLTALFEKLGKEESMVKPDDSSGPDELSLQ